MAVLSKVLSKSISITVYIIKMYFSIRPTLQMGLKIQNIKYCYIAYIYLKNSLPPSLSLSLSLPSVLFQAFSQDISSIMAA